MKVKDLIELLTEESPKARLAIEFDNLELEIDEWNIESSEELVTLRLIEK
jgi:hypothetical protein